MKYPDWAPPSLVKRHKYGVNSNVPERKFKTDHPDVIVADVAQKNKSMKEKPIENFRRHLYQSSFYLPDKESTELLGRLITYPRMKEAWKTLNMRDTKHNQLDQFFSECEKGIVVWRGDPKQTAAERKKFYQEIRDTAQELTSLMSKSRQFDIYHIHQLIDDQRIKWLMESLDTGNKFLSTQFAVSEIVPRIDAVLLDISEKATQYGEEESLVKKPNSENANIHYFIRSLSQYLNNMYGQPLHEVVAATTEVAFDRRESIHSDYVRKIVG